MWLYTHRDQMQRRFDSSVQLAPTDTEFYVVNNSLAAVKNELRTIEAQKAIADLTNPLINFNNTGKRQ